MVNNKNETAIITAHILYQAKVDKSLSLQFNEFYSLSNVIIKRMRLKRGLVSG